MYGIIAARLAIAQARNNTKPLSYTALSAFATLPYCGPPLNRERQGNNCVLINAGTVLY